MITDEQAESIQSELTSYHHILEWACTTRAESDKSEAIQNLLSLIEWQAAKLVEAEDDDKENTDFIEYLLDVRHKLEAENEKLRAEVGVLKMGFEPDLQQENEALKARVAELEAAAEDCICGPYPCCGQMECYCETKDRGL